MNQVPATVFLTKNSLPLSIPSKGEKWAAFMGIELDDDTIQGHFPELGGGTVFSWLVFVCFIP